MVKASDVSSIEIPSSLVKDTLRFLRERGCQGLEGLAFWVGRIAGSGTAKTTRLYIPKQIAVKTSEGVAVIMTPDAQLRFLKSLKNGEIGLIKVHSHPERAYLSPVDRANPSFCFEGAVSIVVPNFGKSIEATTLTDCAVFRREKERWVELNCLAISDLIRIVR